jgi:hypothetical protein
MEAFFRSAARRPSRSSWTVDEAARYAALKEGYLLQFLSEHKGAFFGDGASPGILSSSVAAAITLSRCRW